VDEFTNFNEASNRTLENFFKALIFAFGTRLRRGWFFFIKKKEQKKNDLSVELVYNL
jgi:hypothetical protein